MIIASRVIPFSLFLPWALVVSALAPVLLLVVNEAKLVGSFHPACPVVAVAPVARLAVDGAEVGLEAKDPLEHLDGLLSAEEPAVDVVDFKVLHFTVGALHLCEQLGEVQLVCGMLEGHLNDLVRFKLLQSEARIGRPQFL